MRIGELAERTGASVRSLRHYEAEGLLTAERKGNGYRDFPECTVETVNRVRALLAAGLPISVIRTVLPCVLDIDLKTDLDGVACDSTVATLRAELSRLQAQAEKVERARTTISGMLAG